RVAVLNWNWFQTQGDIWIYDVTRPTKMRLTFDGMLRSRPVWSPDGRYLTYSVRRKGVLDIYRKSSDGQGDEEPLFQNDLNKVPWAWSPDGALIVFGTYRQNEQYNIWLPTIQVDLWVLPLGGGQKPYPYLKSPF